MLNATLMPGDLPLLRRLALSQDEDFAPPKVAAGIVMVVAAVCLFFLVWSSFTHIDEVTHAKGEVVPSGYVQVVQHLEGGILSDILVKEGQLVEPGQVLLRLDGAGSDKDLAELIAKQRSLLIRAEMLSAFLAQRKPDFIRAARVTPDRAAAENARFEDMKHAFGKERDVVASQLSQKREALHSLAGRAQTSQQNVVLMSQAYDMQARLMEQGLGTRMRLIERQEALNSERGEHAQILSDIDKTKEEVVEFERRLSSLDADQRDRANQELAKIEADAQSGSQAIQKFSERVGRLDVKSPVRGVVKGLSVNTIGEVIEPGEKLLEIVPTGKELVIEARIPPSEIGHIHVGQPVRVKVQSYDYTRYGTVDGTLKALSATTFLDEAKQGYYKAEITLRSSHVGDDPSANPIFPGMTVDADVVTGEKTVIGYLLKPIQRALGSAMSER